MLCIRRIYTSMMYSPPSWNVRVLGVPWMGIISSLFA